MRASKILRRVGLALMLLWGTLASLFISGYAFEDLPLASAILETAAWVVPMLVLLVVGWRAPEPIAIRVLAAAVGVLGVGWTANLAAPEWWARLFDTVGPVLAVAGIAVTVPLAALGQRRPLLAGVLLVVAAFLPVIGVGGLVGGFMRSATIATLPNLVIGLVFLVAGLIERDATRSTR
jgi:hypothetical protein